MYHHVTTSEGSIEIIHVRRSPADLFKKVGIALPIRWFAIEKS